MSAEDPVQERFEKLHSAWWALSPSNRGMVVAHLRREAARVLHILETERKAVDPDREEPDLQAYLAEYQPSSIAFGLAAGLVSLLGESEFTEETP